MVSKRWTRLLGMVPLTAGVFDVGGGSKREEFGEMRTGFSSHVRLTPVF